MTEAEKLIEELGTLMGKTDAQSEQRRDEISFWFRDNNTPENDALMEKFLSEGISRYTSELDSLYLQKKVNDIRLDVSWREVANKYMHKPAEWLHERIDGFRRNGTIAEPMTKEELEMLKNGLLDLSDRIRRVAESL